MSAAAPDPCRLSVAMSCRTCMSRLFPSASHACRVVSSCSFSRVKFWSLSASFRSSNDFRADAAAIRAASASAVSGSFSCPGTCSACHAFTKAASCTRQVSRSAFHASRSACSRFFSASAFAFASSFRALSACRDSSSICARRSTSRAPSSSASVLNNAAADAESDCSCCSCTFASSRCRRDSASNACVHFRTRNPLVHFWITNAFSRSSRSLSSSWSK